MRYVVETNIFTGLVNTEFFRDYRLALTEFKKREDMGFGVYLLDNVTGQVLKSTYTEVIGEYRHSPLNIPHYNNK